MSTCCRSAAAEQDNQPIAILAEVDTIPRAEIHSQFKDTGANSLDHGEIAGLQPSIAL
jgi:hypothetical protein